MTWALEHLDDITAYAVQHAWLAGLPLVLGLLIALPLGWLARARGWLYGPVVAGTGLLYTIPSLALFILMPLILGTRILDPVNVVVAMTIYTVALLTRTVADGLGAVDDTVVAAATAMGLGRMRRLFTVELPLAVPVVAAGLRVAAVSNVSIVSVAALIGVPQLGSLFTDGFYRNFLDPVIAGLIGCAVLALVFDAVIVLVARLLTPWQRAGRSTRPAIRGAS
jgi:osmoprotectant transport system permease protein